MLIIAVSISYYRKESQRHDKKKVNVCVVRTSLTAFKMGGLFSSKKKSPPQQQPNKITEQDKAVLVGTYFVSNKVKKTRNYCAKLTFHVNYYPLVYVVKLTIQFHYVYLSF